MEAAEKQLRLLVVEDDQIVADNLRASLERQGHTVVGVTDDSSDALEIASRGRVDLALLDIRLGNSSAGLDLARGLKEKWQVPVVFVTGYSNEKVFEHTREIRPAGFLRKPFSDAELAACIQIAVDRIDAQQEYSGQEEAIRNVVESLTDAVIAADLDGRITLMNAAAEKLTEWMEVEAKGRALREVARVEEIEGAAGAEPEPVSGEREEDLLEQTGVRTLALRTRTGKRIPVEERSSPVKSRSGQVVGLVSIFRKAEPGEKDGAPAIRARMLASAERLSRRPAFRELMGKRGAGSDAEGNPPEPAPTEGGERMQNGASLIDEIADPLLTLDAEWRITYANAEALVYFGGKTALIGRNFWDGFAPTAWEKYLVDMRKPVVDGRRHGFEFYDSERERWLDVSVYRSGEGVLALFRDISHRKRLEAESVRMQRLEGLGLLARGFAHDFNNLLTVLIGNLGLARERGVEDPDYKEEMRSAEQAAEQARNLVLQLLTFAQGGRPILEDTRIAELIRNSLSERRVDHPSIRYQFQCRNPNLRVRVDRGQISRLIENLIINGEQAMPDGGTLIARCGMITGEEVSRLKRIPVPPDDDHLIIEVIDTGRGMADDELAHAFEPYFTTRTGANATGIGLTVCESIAKSHDGFIVLQSKEGRGTIATFCMPLGPTPSWADSAEVDLPAAATVPAGPPDSLPSRGSGGAVEAESPGASRPARILVLEDDPMIRRLIVVTLRRDGHEVVETADGYDTVRLYREAMEGGRRFDLVLSDLTIEPGLGGVETIRSLRKIDPNVLAIVSSGYSDAPAMSRPGAFGFSAVLPKPYPPRELRRVVAATLERYAPQRFG